MKKLTCPQCKEENKRSIIYESRTSISTLASYRPFFDEEGNRHNHDSNIYTKSYTCSNGHKFTKSSKKRRLVRLARKEII